MESLSVNSNIRGSNSNSNSYFRIMNRDFKLWQSLLLTFVTMSALLLYVYNFNVPNPNMILIAGLVICSAVFGYEGGILAAVIMLFYTLYFFSDG
ncbi:MAG: hypothetical protein IJH95_07420, partial [Mogibacterium sp.]|nr:hypothetical protein [Mogibacterium sp.]